MPLAPHASRILIPVLICTVALGCGRADNPPAASVAPMAEAQPASTGGAHGDGIDWFAGSVDDAFALAKAERKPVFLYWGAVWCPPCHYLRNKIFTRPSFQEQMRHVVPVYLDGDTERAQTLGERFGTQGYPTVIVFDPEGREVTRLPSMLPVEEYGEALDRALSSARPIVEVLAAVEQEGPARASQSGLGQLAFYAWNQDHALDLSPERRRDLFRRLWEETPANLASERSRFLALYVAELARQARSSAGAVEEGQPAPIAEAERARVDEALQTLLAQPKARRVNLELVLYQLPGVVPALHPQPGAARDRLLAAWDRAAVAVEADATLSVDDRLSALYPRLAAARLGTAATLDDEAAATPLPAALVDHVRERIRWADATVRDEGELQAVMSTMAGLLEEAGLRDEARTLLTSHLDDTVAPYYYVSYLAGIEEEAGNNVEAVALYRQAYDAAEGSMTRFRWGTTYLRKAMELTPDSPAIEQDLDTIVGDLLAVPDAFAGGNWGRLQQLGTALDAWSGDETSARARAVDALRREVRGACERFPDRGDDSPRDRCGSFLEPKAASRT